MTQGLLLSSSRAPVLSRSEVPLFDCSSLVSARHNPQQLHAPRFTQVAPSAPSTMSPSDPLAELHTRSAALNEFARHSLRARHSLAARQRCRPRCTNATLARDPVLLRAGGRRASPVRHSPFRCPAFAL